MNRRGLSPSFITFSAAISACEKGAPWQRVGPLFPEMCSGGLAIRSQLARGIQWQRVAPLLDGMRRRGLSPN
eukprot:3816388-Karenia_brevis.AAC.1